MSRGNGGQTLFRTDKDRRRFLGLLSELPERFGTEVHAFVLMDNHYHLLLRCRRAEVSHAMQWLQTAYAIRFNGSHRRRGHVFQGRFKSVLILDEAGVAAVARYLHLNPVRIRGLGLSKEDQRRAKVMGCEDPGAELISRRLRVLRENRWSSWRVYAGLEAPPTWLTLEPVGSGCGGRGSKGRRAALIAYTEEPIRQGRLDSPWEGLMAGIVLGDREEAVALLRASVRKGAGRAREASRAATGLRPEWKDIVQGAELLLGRSWKQMSERHGDWGRDGTMAVATRHLGWRLSEVVAQESGVQYAAAAQATRRFWLRAEEDPERARFAGRLSKQMSIVHV